MLQDERITVNIPTKPHPTEPYAVHLLYDLAVWEGPVMAIWESRKAPWQASRRIIELLHQSFGQASQAHLHDFGQKLPTRYAGKSGAYTRSVIFPEMRQFRSFEYAGESQHWWQVHQELSPIYGGGKRKGDGDDVTGYLYSYIRAKELAAVLSPNAETQQAYILDDDGNTLARFLGAHLLDKARTRVFVHYVDAKGKEFSV